MSSIHLTFGFLAIVGEKFVGIISDLFKSLFNFLIKPFLGLDGLNKLIYGYGEDTELVYHTFHSDEITNIVSPGIQITSYIVMFLIIVGVIVSGARLASTGTNPSTRTSFITTLRDWAVIAIVLANIGFFYDALFTLNDFFVGVFKEAVDVDLQGSIMPKLEGENFLGWMLVMLIVLGVTLWANLYYLMRKLTLLVLLILGPLFISISMLPNGKKITMTWLKELFGTTMVQAVHAVTFWIVAFISRGLGTEDVGFINMALLYVVIIPLGESIRGLLHLGGDMNGRLGKFGAMAGLAGLSGISRSIKSAFNSQHDGLGRKRGNTSDDGSSKSQKALSTVGTTSAAEKMIRRGQISSKLGKAVFGSVGSIAGTPMGPIGAMVGSEIGSNVGGAAGAVGRGATAFGQLAKKGAIAAYNGGKGVFNDSKDNLLNSSKQEKLANEIGKVNTEAWAKQNEEAFKNEIRENNPGMSEEDVNRAWLKKLNGKQAEFTKLAKQELLSGGFTNNSKARANELAHQVANGDTKEWSEANRDQFIQNRKAEGMSDEEAKAAWNKESENKYKQNLGIAQKVAKKLTNGKPLDSYVDSQSFANGYANAKLDEAKQEFKNSYFKQNPNASNEQFENAWESASANTKENLLSNAKRSVSQVPTISSIRAGANDAKASDLTQQVAHDMTNQWAKQNKGRFVENLKSQGGQIGDVEIEQAWENEVRTKFSQNLKDANLVANEMTNGKSLGTFIDRNEFADKFSNYQLGNIKGNFINEQVQNGIPMATAEAAFDNSNVAKDFKSDVYDSISKVPSLSLSKGYETRDGIAHQVATNLTNQWATPQQKQAFVNQFKESYSGNGAPPPQMIESAWNDKVNGVYNSHLQDAQGRISEESLKGFVMPSAGNVIKGVGKGFYTGSGLQNAVESVKNSKPIVFGSTMVDSLADGQGVLNSFQVAHSTASAMGQENAVEKAHNYRNAMAYVGGLVGGVSGYSLGASFANKHNPYNNTIQNSTMEVSDIARIAKTEMVDKGNGEMVSQIAKGAIQLVVEKDRSYVQVQGKNNQYQVVSKYGAGDSSLQDGQVVFQDYTIDNGMLLPQMTKGSQPSAYMKDTAGYKIPYSNPLNIAAGNLLANRRVISNQQMEPMHDAYNQQVLMGNFTIQDFQSNSPDQIATVVIEQNRSYTAMKGNDGQTYRVSDFGKGNPNLAPGQVQYKEFVLENATFTDSPKNSNVHVESYEYSMDGQKRIIDGSSIHKDFNPNKSLNYKTNQRYEKRKELEKKRFKQGVV